MLLLKNILLNHFKYKRKALHYFANINYRTACNAVNKFQVLFFGTDNFSLPSLKALHKCSNLTSLGVVTSFKNPVNCVRLYAIEQQLPLYCWPITPANCVNYQLGVVVSFGHLIPANIIDAFSLGMINVHASLLPRWRGAAPIVHALMSGDTKTGVTIMKIEPHRFDVGDILTQREVLIDKHDYMPELHAQLANVGAELLVSTLKNLSTNLKFARRQNEAEATYAPKITSKITEVNWCSLSAKELHNRYRALYGFKNLTTTYLNRQVELLDMRLPHILPNMLPKEPGSFFYLRDKKSLLICCAKQTYIEVVKLRLEGKKAMSAMDFNNGFLRQRLQICERLFKQNKKVSY